MEFVELLLLRPFIHRDMYKMCTEVVKGDKMYLNDKVFSGDGVFPDDCDDHKKVLLALHEGVILPDKLFKKIEISENKKVEEDVQVQEPQDKLFEVLDEHEKKCLNNIFTQIGHTLEDESTSSMNGNNWNMLGSSRLSDLRGVSMNEDDLKQSFIRERGFTEVRRTSTADNGFSSSNYNRGVSMSDGVRNKNMKIFDEDVREEEVDSRLYTSNDQSINLPIASSFIARNNNIFDDNFLLLDNEIKQDDAPIGVKSIIFGIEKSSEPSKEYVSMPEELKKSLSLCSQTLIRSIPSGKKSKNLENFFNELQTNSSNLPLNRLAANYSKYRIRSIEDVKAEEKHLYRSNPYFESLVQIFLSKNEEQKIVNLYLFSNLLKLSTKNESIKESLLNTKLTIETKSLGTLTFESLIDMMLYDTLNVRSSHF